ncbi:PRC-barrel domain-containing protein [Prochlorococcus marinus]|uniref:PRC-barrel domain-containing protein n=1 Tax=Prochlorococcus marinus (strain MIT 9211) TaxID=93059 RepID=A9B9J9_PROM4|nr:PRC-barrel domain-containing protein [Prochlorococcus marinus]ABX07932.1 conserved hypothetical protein [Prochlorococcus marinus str. MIT 9211]
MTLSNELLLSNLLNHNVRCDKGIDHGPGIIAWMHPPVHRLLGWATRPSTLKLSRDVWRLNQLKGISSQELYVKGIPAQSDQATLDRFPTLLEADLINRNGEKIALIADFVFDYKTGKILYYLVSRSNPKIPGTSRWQLSLDKIIDQQPGLVFTNNLRLDDFPILKSSFRQNLLKKSLKLRDQFQEISLRANTRLEGWLEELPWDDEELSENFSEDNSRFDLFGDWDINNDDEAKQFYINSSSRINNPEKEGDPWI